MTSKLPPRDVEEGGSPAGLILVPTPIGNLDDITLRAVQVLGTVDHVVAEDTRRTRKLLAHFGLDASRLHRLDAHAREGDLRRVVEWLQEGRSVAVVTDAGMPTVSDPGAAVVRMAVEAHLEVTALPGPSAVTTAVAASGLVDGPFYFAGFLPRSGLARAEAIESLARREEPCVLFEAPQRMEKTLRDLAAVMPQRQVCVGREISKLHEQYLRGSLEELAGQERQWRGEFTLVLGPWEPGEEGPVDDRALEARVDELLAEGKHTRTVAAELAAWSGRPKREVYELVVRRKALARGRQVDQGKPSRKK